MFTSISATNVSGAHLIPVGASAWRVTAPNGRIMGHVERVSDPDERFRARRFHVPTRQFVELGTFWRIDDAVATVRWS